MDVKKIAQAMFDEMMRDKSSEEVFTDKHGNRLAAGMRVLWDGEILGTVEHCRFAYPRSMGFDNQLPLCMVKFDEPFSGLNGSETATSRVEIVGQGRG
jgi:hypothetical protein